MLILKTVKRQTLILISLSLPGNILFPYGKNFHWRAKARINSKSLKCLLFSSDVLSCVHSNINIFTFKNRADSKYKLPCIESLLHQLTSTHSLRGGSCQDLVQELVLILPFCGANTLFTQGLSSMLFIDSPMGGSK